MKKLVSMLLPVSLALGVCALGLTRAVQTSAKPWAGSLAPGALFCVLYVAWILFELLFLRREEAAKRSDYGTREVYAASHAATILCALWFSPVDSPPVVRIVLGGLLFVFGVALRLSAVLTLGRFYSHSVRTVAGHQVVVTGPYRILRHPAYAGMLLAHAGVIIYFFSVPALAVYLLALFPAIGLRIVVEERTLMQLDGYREFARARKRLFPGLW